MENLDGATSYRFSLAATQIVNNVSFSIFFFLVKNIEPHYHIIGLKYHKFVTPSTNLYQQRISNKGLEHGLPKIK